MVLSSQNKNKDKILTNPSAVINYQLLTDALWPVKECTKLPSTAFHTHIRQSAFQETFLATKTNKQIPVLTTKQVLKCSYETPHYHMNEKILKNIIPELSKSHEAIS